MDNRPESVGGVALAPESRFRVLVAVAPGCGTPATISDVIAQTFRTSGFDTTLMPLEDITSLDEYDAVVAGSAVQNGRWIGAAKEFVTKHKSQLRKRMVWLFSSGSMGRPGSQSEIVLLDSLADPLEHKLFNPPDTVPGPGLAGSNDPSGCCPDEVRRWALHVAGALSVAASSPPAH